MKISSLLIIASAPTLLVLSGCSLLSGSRVSAPENSSNTISKDPQPAPEVKTTWKTSLTITKDEPTQPASGNTQQKAGSYGVYSEGAVQQAFSRGEKVALFFNASWCPTCKQLNQDILTNVWQLPAWTALFSVDYDTATTMKQKYGVKQQHTVVLIDKDLNLVQTRIGPDFAGVVNLLK